MASQPGSTGSSDGGDGRSTQWPLPSSRSGSATCFSLGAGGELTEMFVYTDGQGLKEWVWGVRVKEVWGRSKGMDGLQASHTHLTGCLAVQDALDRQVEKMALSALVGQLPCPASPLFAQKAHERSANVGTGADHLRVTELGLSPPRPVWLLPPPSTQSIRGEANTERWVVWGPSLGLQPAPPLGTSVCVCVRAHVCVCACTRISHSVVSDSL